MNKLIQGIVKDKKTCYFISPHLDDAALSAGGLISYLSKKTKVVVVTVFTEVENESSFSAKAYLKQCNYNDPKELYLKRRTEDISTFNNINVKTIHLGFIDALWRKKNKFLIRSNLFARLLPELACVYPTYRFHISKGRISKNDLVLINSIELKLRNILKLERSNCVVFCPVGVGNHVDHLIVKKAVEKISEPIYWADQPYATRSPEDVSLNLSAAFKFPVNYKQKERLVLSYEAQVKAMFDDSLPSLEETFFLDDPVYCQTLPVRINGFKLIKEALKEKKPKPFVYGIYENNKGQLAFAKHWSGKKKNRNYYELNNEISAYKLIRDISNSAEVQRMHPNIKVPKFLAACEDDNSLTLLIEKVEGSYLSGVSENKRIQILSEVFDYLHFINHKLPPQVQPTIMYRGNIFWILVLPFISVFAILRHRQYYFLILKGLWFFTSKTPLLLKDDSLGFVHRDLGTWNILTNQDKAIVYDFQLSCIANPLLEYASTGLKEWSGSNFSDKIFKKIIRPKIKDNDKLGVFCALSVCLSIYDLALSDGGPPQYASNFLGHCLTLDRKVLSDSLYSQKNTLYRDLLLLIATPKDYLFSFTYSARKRVLISKYNPISRKIAKNFIRKIEKNIPGALVHFVGSSSLGICGAKDIDLIVESSAENYSNNLRSLSDVLGKPIKTRSQFSEWKIYSKGYTIEISLFDSASHIFKERTHHDTVLKQNKGLLKEYEELKKSSANVSLREYDRRKIEFFNRVSKHKTNEGYKI